MTRLLNPKLEAPPPPPPPPSPTSNDKEEARRVQEEMNKAAAAERNAKGRSATLLTGGQGVTEEAPTTKKVLLGS